MRAAEERYPRLPGVDPRADGARGSGRRARGDARVSGGDDASRVSAAAARTEATGASRRAFSARRDTSPTRRTRISTRYEVVVDALFGTGFHGAPRPEAAELIGRMNAAERRSSRSTCPRASTPRRARSRAWRSRPTSPSPSTRRRWVSSSRPGRFSAGRVVVADIGLDDGRTQVRRATPAILDEVPLRGARDTKYSSGSVLVVGGQPGTAGAACLTAMAALRADAGYVTLAVPEESLHAAEALALEPVKLAWSDDDALEKLEAAAERASALAIGPGLGRSEARDGARPGAARAHRPPGRRRRGRPVRARAGRAPVRRRC